MKFVAKAFTSIVAAALFAVAARADDPPAEPEVCTVPDAVVQQYIKKMKEANYPALFDKAAQEFGVPSDVLKGIAFAETRWEHLQWPEWDSNKPWNGPLPAYGIMSLWDDEYFGHSLIDAAKLIGKEPDELKQDAYQNIRGAAALLKKIYNDIPKPDYAREGEIESWTHAISKYCGIPERDLSAQHAVDVFDWMSEGYHEYGIEWDKRAVNLGPMKEELARIKAEEKAKRDEREVNDIVSSADPIPENVETQSPEWCSVSVVALAKPVQPNVNRKAAEIMMTIRPAEAEAVVAGALGQQKIERQIFAGAACFVGLLAFLKKSPNRKK